MPCGKPTIIISVISEFANNYHQVSTFSFHTDKRVVTKVLISEHHTRMPIRTICEHGHVYFTLKRQCKMADNSVETMTKYDLQDSLLQQQHRYNWHKFDVVIPIWQVKKLLSLGENCKTLGVKCTYLHRQINKERGGDLFINVYLFRHLYYAYGFWLRFFWHCVVFLIVIRQAQSSDYILIIYASRRLYWC